MDNPRLSRMGLPVFAAAISSWKFWRIARADLDDVGIFGDHIGVGFGKQFGDDGQAGLRAALWRAASGPFRPSPGIRRATFAA